MVQREIIFMRILLQLLTRESLVARSNFLYSVWLSVDIVTQCSLCIFVVINRARVHIIKASDEF